MYIIGVEQRVLQSVVDGQLLVVCTWGKDRFWPFMLTWCHIQACNDVSNYYQHLDIFRVEPTQIKFLER